MSTSSTKLYLTIDDNKNFSFLLTTIADECEVSLARMSLYTTHDIPLTTASIQLDGYLLLSTLFVMRRIKTIRMRVATSRASSPRQH
eukprot:scaffold187374_cov16-Prasinocladus_malaysianus.AAC.1